MLKKLCGLFLGLVVLIGSACVTPTHASSASSILITHIQAGGINAARQEFVVLHNSSSMEVDITSWCLHNKYSVSFYCFKDGTDQTGYILPAASWAVVVSEEYQDTLSVEESSLYPQPYSYAVTNQSSGSIVGSADTISLTDEQGEVVAEKSWSTALASGKIFSRALLLPEPPLYSTLGTDADWRIEPSPLELPINGVTEYTQESIDQPTPPDAPDEPTNPEPIGATPELLPLRLSELLPNPEGSDVGFEYIELYNPNLTHEVSLALYSLKVGPLLEKTYRFSDDNPMVQPGEYLVVTNSTLPFTLLNSSSSVQLFYGDSAVGAIVSYTEPASNEAWAELQGVWVYTNRLTPGAKNEPSQVSEGEDISEVVALKPCAPNQYRSPETNRCRLISTTQASLTPCKENQYRSEETNRCRNFPTGTEPAPCDEGQERNPETNRCRKIAQITSVGEGVKGIEMTDVGVHSYVWLALGGFILAVVSYAVWEWRVELRSIYRRVKRSFTGRGT